MSCLARVVRDSSQVGGNIPQVITSPGGERHVKFFNWSEFLSKYFKVIPSITSYHVFRGCPYIVFISTSGM